MQYGIDFLGGARYAKTVLAEQPRAFGFGIFADVDGFGKAYSLIEQVAALKVPFIRVQLMWKDDHKFTAADLPEIRARAKRISQIVARFPGISWYVSPCCEHELKEAQWLEFANATRANCPNAVIVNSPNKGKGFVSAQYINEYHHEDKPRAGGKYAFSYDGANQVDSDIEKHKVAFKDAEYFMLWNSQCNGNRKIFKPGDKRQPNDYVDRAKRVFWPTAKQIDSWVWQAINSKGSVKLPVKLRLKSHSDQHAVTPSDKDQKPVWIAPVKASAIVVKARNGQVIDSARYYGTFSGGGFRYYHNQWGFELAQKAIRIQKDAVCDVFVNDKKVGTINLAFRDGVYR